MLKGNKSKSVMEQWEENNILLTFSVCHLYAVQGLSFFF